MISDLIRWSTSYILRYNAHTINLKSCQYQPSQFFSSLQQAIQQHFIEKQVNIGEFSSFSHLSSSVSSSSSLNILASSSSYHDLSATPSPQTTLNSHNSSFVNRIEYDDYGRLKVINHKVNQHELFYIVIQSICYICCFYGVDLIQYHQQQPILNNHRALSISSKNTLTGHAHSPHSPVSSLSILPHCWNLIFTSKFEPIKYITKSIRNEFLKLVYVSGLFNKIVWNSFPKEICLIELANLSLKNNHNAGGEDQPLSQQSHHSQQQQQQIQYIMLRPLEESNEVKKKHRMTSRTRVTTMATTSSQHHTVMSYNQGDYEEEGEEMFLELEETAELDVEEEEDDLYYFLSLGSTPSSSGRSQSSTSSSASSTSSSLFSSLGPNTLELFFPFDPCLLMKIYSSISSSYRSWNGNIPGITDDFIYQECVIKEKQALIARETADGGRENGLRKVDSIEFQGELFGEDLEDDDDDEGEDEEYESEEENGEGDEEGGGAVFEGSTLPPRSMNLSSKDLLIPGKSSKDSKKIQQQLEHHQMTISMSYTEETTAYSKEEEGASYGTSVTSSVGRSYSSSISERQQQHHHQLGRSQQKRRLRAASELTVDEPEDEQGDEDDDGSEIGSSYSMSITSSLPREQVMLELIERSKKQQQRQQCHSNQL
jgi:hypothetical protein